MTLSPRAAVIAPAAVPTLAVPGAKASYRVPVDRENAGCQNLIQRIFYYEAGTSPEMKNDFSEEVLYIVAGVGQATIDGQTVSLTPSTGLLIPPGASYTIHNPGPEPLEFVSVLSPQPARPGSVPPSPETQPVSQLALHESQEAPIPAGPDRYFKLMIDPRYGAQYVTQFIGFIEKSRAPLHVHTYEEVIYILSGQGQVHIDDGVFPMSAGTSIYLPPGTPHCLENTSPETLSLLGVFCPAGSPANRTNVGDDKGENVVD